jgi:hypothetical protein
MRSQALDLNPSGANYIHGWNSLCSGNHPASDVISEVQQRLSAHALWQSQAKPGDLAVLGEDI